MPIEGVDVSNHQATFDFRGWQFAIIKSSEGNTFRDFRFTQHLNAARAAGCIVAAYHYQRDVSARSQFDLIRSVVPTSIPVIIDVEDGSGSLSITRDLIRLLREAGYRSPLLYLPRWHWRNIGSPSLAGLPPLWGSDYRGGSADWSPYGGLDVALRQYTSTPHDKNWFGGTKEQFAALLGAEEREEDELNDTEKARLEQTEAYARETWQAVGADDDKDGRNNLWEHVDFLGNLILELKALVVDLTAKVEAIETGGVSDERIAEIAKDAISDDLKNDEE